VSPELCDARAGAVHERASERRIEYAALDPASLLEGEVEAVESGSHDAATCDQTDPLGRPIPRFDLPAKLRGAPSYVHDIRLPDMLHGRVLRASIPGATLLGFDESVLDRFGVRVRVLRDGNFAV
jgi:hypothetical protein